MPAHRISKRDAQRIAVRAQALDATRPHGLLELVHRLTVLQFDVTNAVAPSADLVVWGRLGSAWSPTELADALDRRDLIDLRGMIRPVEDLALYRDLMETWRIGEGFTGWRRSLCEWVRANDRCRRDILAALDEAGPLPATELPDTCDVPWRSSGWNHHRNVGQLLDAMVRRGEVAAAGRANGQRLWDLADEVYPNTPIVPEAEAALRRDERRLGALGIARAKGPECSVEPIDVRRAGEPAVVDGLPGEWRVDPAHLEAVLDSPFDGRLVVLSPIDRLVFDRKRMVELFDFDYQLEMYKPAAKRRWGYWAMPILWRERLVGKVDAAADRTGGALRVNAVHRDVDFTKQMDNALDRALRDLARWLRLELTGTW